MKQLTLNNPSYGYLEKAYREWLDILGYCKESVDHMPAIIREFLHFLETNKVNQITELQPKHYKSYFTHISSRSNLRRGGGLSNNYLNKHIQSLEKFYEFLVHKGTQGIPPVNLRQLQLAKDNITVLTTTEIQTLYKATYRDLPANLPKATESKWEAFNARDRAMLTVFYSCGLRRKEGAHLTIDDVNFDRRILHVKKGKNYKRTVGAVQHLQCETFADLAVRPPSRLAKKQPEQCTVHWHARQLHDRGSPVQAVKTVAVSCR